MKKPISTKQSDSNIQEVLRLLSESPKKLGSLSNGLSQEQIHARLGPGERSFHQTLAHLTHVEARTNEAILMALLADQPLVPRIHAERDLGKLVRFDLLDFSELQEYFNLRRTVLLRILDSLPEGKWSRAIREPGKQRRESVYLLSRSLALHEWEHLQDLEGKIDQKS